MRTSPGIRRIVLLAPGAFGLLGGIQMYNRLLIKTFSDLMADVDGTCEVFILNDPEDCADEKYLTKATVIRSFSGNRLRFVLAVLGAFMRSRPDLLIVGHVNFALLSLLLRGIRPRTAQWFITYGVDVWLRLSMHCRVALRKAQRVLAISDFTRSELMRHNDLSGTNCELLPCALDPFWTRDFSALAATSSFPPRPVILTCARLTAADRYKGVDCLISALPFLTDKYGDLKLVIVGDGDDRPYLEELAVTKNVRDRVEFLGRASRRELAEAYANCTIFAMPSKKEGFGIVFLEAAFFGKPSVGGNHGGTPEIIEDGRSGWLVTYGDVTGIADAIDDALRDKDRLRDAGECARRHMCARFSADAFHEQVATLAGMTS